MVHPRIFRAAGELSGHKYISFYLWIWLEKLTHTTFPRNRARARASFDIFPLAGGKGFCVELLWSRWRSRLGILSDPEVHL